MRGHAFVEIAALAEPYGRNPVRAWGDFLDWWRLAQGKYLSFRQALGIYRYKLRDGSYPELAYWRFRAIRDYEFDPRFKGLKLPPKPPVIGGTLSDTAYFAQELGREA
jgi:hypothetical protein